MVVKSKTFEQSLEALEAIVGKLESDELDLDKSLELFEKGVILYKDCRKQLDKVEKKIAKLSENLKEESLGN